MVFKKPYAFFIKYFKLINFVLVFLNAYLIYKLNMLHNILNNIYFGRITNYINLDNNYIGFIMYLLIIIISSLVLIIILTLRKKQKPYKDYLYNIIYNILLFAYFLSVSNLFLQLNTTVIEQTTLKLYSDISLLIFIPLIYFVIKYILIVIGFNISKFNFQKDIIELKETDEDNEEIELIFDKNRYKAKRRFRKTIRELKYYFIENKLILTTIIIIIALFFIIYLLTFRFNDKSSVNIGNTFIAGNFSYKVLNVYETSVDSKGNDIKDDSKFVIVQTTIKNNSSKSERIDFNRIRLFYGDDYVYANDFYNKFLSEFKPYSSEVLKSYENFNYSFIFKVPKNYKSNKYILKFYDKLLYNEELVGIYKEMNVNAKKLDSVQKEEVFNLNESVILDRDIYGKSNLTIYKYSLANSYTYKNDNNTFVIKDSNINNILFILNYALLLDENLKITNINNAKDFFNNHVSIEYKIDDVVKKIKNVNVIENLENQIFISVPYNIKNAENINILINFRNKIIKYIII